MSRPGPKSELHCLRVFVMAIMLATIYAACGQRSAAPSTIQIFEQDDGDTVLLKRGDTLWIALAGNPSTGYAWEVVSVDPAVLEMTGEPLFAPESDLLGAGGTVTLTFKGIGVGETAMELAYQRPFEAQQPPLRTFAVMIRVD